MVELPLPLCCATAGLAKPREAAASTSTATKQLAAAIAAAAAVLKDQLDALAPQLAAVSPQFVADYRAARIIVDSTGGNTKKPATPPTPPGDGK